MGRIGAAVSVAIATAALAVAGSAAAQESTTTAPPAPATPISWSVAPSARPDQSDRPNFVVDAARGETVSDSLIVTNRSDVNLVLGVYARDAFNTPDGKIDLLAGDEDPVDVGLWTAVDTPSVTVPAGGEIVVPFTITVPADASPGDHVGGIVTSLTITEQDAAGNRVRVERRLGTRIYLRVDGELEPSLRFTKVSARYEGSWNPFAPGKMVVDYTVSNTGNVRLRAERTTTVQPGLGLPELTDEPDDMEELLPGNSYELRQEVDGVWPAFGTGVEVELRPYDSLASSDVAPPPVIGRYRTSMFPTPQVVALVIVVLVLLLVWRRRRRNRRAMEASIQAAVDKALADKAAGSPSAEPPPVPVPAGPHDPGVPPPWPPAAHS